MPIYEYKCAECGAKFEKLVRGGAANVDVKCPSCESRVVKRQMSACGMIGLGGDPGAASQPSSCAPSGGG